ncbi:MAG: hypothetical protein M0R30_07455 [Methanoregula sp.]|jgi:hypothetical protein|uniref:hypothetical protein n=1 Tax=Methanoregula sp. TaxID=2052170 RepID=UPI0025E5D0A0|nr:hypothetical protein [Methanoregula sp.]MCK9631466.1 hypothetical protein [Methanoregula sp.]
MEQKFIAVTGVLILTGLIFAFAIAFLVDGVSGRTEDLWLVQNTQLTHASDPPSENGSEIIPKTTTENETYPRPVVSNNWSNASRTSIKLKTVAYNQSAALVSSPGGKLGMLLLIDRNDPETITGALTAEQRKQAEKIALADARVQDIIGAGMYNVDIQPLNRIQVKNSEEIPLRGTGVSIVFTTVNTTTARNETTFIVHVDLDKENVVRVSPPIPVRE